MGQKRTTIDGLRTPSVGRYSNGFERLCDRANTCVTLIVEFARSVHCGPLSFSFPFQQVSPLVPLLVGAPFGGTLLVVAPFGALLPLLAVVAAPGVTSCNWLSCSMSSVWAHFTGNTPDGTRRKLPSGLNASRRKKYFQFSSANILNVLAHALDVDTVGIKGAPNGVPPNGTGGKGVHDKEGAGANDKECAANCASGHISVAASTAAKGASLTGSRLGR